MFLAPLNRGMSGIKFCLKVIRFRIKSLLAVNNNFIVAKFFVNLLLSRRVNNALGAFDRQRERASGWLVSLIDFVLVSAVRWRADLSLYCTLRSYVAICKRQRPSEERESLV